MRPAPARAWELPAGIGLLAGVLALVVTRLAPPGPAPAGAPVGEFSAGRALSVLDRLLADGVPHPVGTDANARVRERVLAEFRRLGFTPEVQAAFACGRFGACAQVTNVLARLEGRGPGKAVLLLAHYDSVGAGPGAADDGAGVAALIETARALRAGPLPPRPILFLVTDGEEAGSVGASAFRARHPWARQVGAIVNLEARGTSGPSILFETTGETGWVARRVGALPHPVTGSIYAAVYERMPSDTDLSVFRPDGIPGVNFAFIGDVGRYHTPLDDLDHLNPASVQHEGESALAMARAMADSDLEHPAGGRAIYFDLLGTAVVQWPERWSVPLALGALGLLLLGVGRRARRGELRLPALAWGLAVFGAAPVAGLALALASRAGFAYVASLPQPWIGRTGTALVTFWSAGLAGTSMAGLFLGRRAGEAGLWAGGWVGWAAISVLLAVLAPQASYLFLVPALTAGILGLGWAAWPGSRAWRLVAILAPAAVGALFVFPVAWLLYQAVGLFGAPGISVLVALAVGALVPLGWFGGARRNWILPGIPAAALAAAVLAAAVVPGAGGRRPDLMMLAFHQDADSPRARWLVYAAKGELPGEMRRWAQFTDRPVKPFPWGDARPCFVASAPRLDAPGPELRVIEERRVGPTRVIRARLRSARGAGDVALYFPPGAKVESLEVHGTPVPPPDERVRQWYGGWQPYRYLAVPAEGVELEVVLEGKSPVDVEVVDETPGLPPDGKPLLEERPGSAVTIQDGDATFFTRRVRL